MMDADFISDLSDLLKSDSPAFFSALENGTPHRGLRVNTLKILPKDFLKLFPPALSPAPFAQNGFFARNTDFRYGAAPLHHAGLYYMQEPSAMSAATALIPKLGERVLDLCAAPGGKSGQLAEAMNGKGILVCNEPVFSRAKILSGNLERLGVRNAMVICNTPSELAEIFPGYFDSVLVDAPCSGEGMFRKDPDAILEWSKKNSEASAERQLMILRSAAACLKPGGRLLYSTCTFSERENEGVVRRFLAEFPFRAERIAVPALSPFLSDNGDLPALRVYPHLHPGEGHFACLLQKTDGEPGLQTYSPPYAAPTPKQRQAFSALWPNLSKAPAWGELRSYQGVLYLTPQDMPYSPGLHVLRAGTTVCEEAKDRLLPHHGLALALKAGQAENRIDFSLSSPDLPRYLCGESLDTACGFSGWGIVTIEGYPAGLCKSACGVLKNHYPKGLRNRADGASSLEQ